MVSSDVGSPAGRRQLAFAKNVHGLILKTNVLGILLIGILMIVWEVLVVTKIVDMISFPRMSEIVTTFFSAIASGDILRELVPSLVRMFAGYFLAIAVGVTIGLLMGYFRFMYHLLEPLVELLRPIPSPAYIPMLILFMGIGDSMKVFTIFLASLFPILLNAYTGVRSVDKVQIDTARTFGLGSREILWEVILPASSPYIFAGLRVSLSIALILTVIAEMVAGSNGIGYFVLNMQRSFRIKEMYAGVLVLALLGYSLNRLFLWAEKVMIGWSYAQNRPEEVLSKS